MSSGEVCLGQLALSAAIARARSDRPWKTASREIETRVPDQRIVRPDRNRVRCGAVGILQLTIWGKQVDTHSLYPWDKGRSLG